MTNKEERELNELLDILKQIDGERKLRPVVKATMFHRVLAFFVGVMLTTIMIVHSIWLLIKFVVMWVVMDIYYVGRLLYLLLSIVFLKMISMDKNTLLLLSSAIAVLLLMK